MKAISNDSLHWLVLLVALPVLLLLERWFRKLGLLVGDTVGGTLIITKKYMLLPGFVEDLLLLKGSCRAPGLLKMADIWAPWS